MSRKGIVGRKAWPHSKHIVVRCRIEEAERALSVLHPILEKGPSGSTAAGL